MSTYTPVASQTLSSAAASVTFSSIPQIYTDLVLVCSPVSTTGVNTFLWIRYNDDTSSNYSSTILRGNGSTIGSLRLSSQTYQYICYSQEVPTVAGRTTVITQLQNYSNSRTHKTSLTRNNDASQIVEAIAGLWRNTAPITSITIDMDATGSTIAAGSTFSLYGIQVGDKAQKAEGGDIVVSSGGYIYHAYTSSGTFTPTQSLSADILVVGGGGGGGQFHGGGGGGGAIEGSGFFQTQSLITKSYSVIIGSGGSGGTLGYSGNNGNNSLFYGASTITALGGGGGGSAYVVPSAGGSGGGAGQNNHAGGAANGSNTNAGGIAGKNGNNGGGGGGATAVGENGSSSAGGAGGQGKTLTTIDSNLSALGFAGIVVSSGGGGGTSGDAAGSGGTGAGNGTTNDTTGGNATSFGSGGGGGGYNTDLGGKGGNGYSGLVIIRYAL